MMHFVPDWKIAYWEIWPQDTTKKAIKNYMEVSSAHWIRTETFMLIVEISEQLVYSKFRDTFSRNI